MIKEDYIDIPTVLQQSITPDQAWHYNIIPKTVDKKSLSFYIDKKRNSLIAAELEMLFGKKIELIPVESEIINRSLSKYYRKSAVTKKQAGFTTKSDSDDYIISLIHEAESIGSSDIHIEAYEENCRIRMRIDGKLIERYVLTKNEYPSLINKIKIKANLDIAEKRLPQDGRIYYSDETQKFDIRVSVLPTLHGEKIVMRLLSKDATDIDIEKLGFTKEQLEIYIEGVKKTHGIILISGPTGSGKTTTLYATLKILNQEFSNILTIEDPIEYTLQGINQVQLRENIGLSFAHALRTFLRQDPDIIMLGEIRDNETAQMATRAALTGHLVLSTIHTNSAWGTISRLIDMGVPPFLVANTLNLSIAQRLIRLLCPRCKKEKNFDASELPRTYHIKTSLSKQYIPVGCDECYYTGYRGRTAIYEVIPIDARLSGFIKENELNISNYLKENNIKSLPQSAFELFEKGETSLEEIYSILLTNF
jgi:type IV pilus assembly protein PilB